MKFLIVAAFLLICGSELITAKVYSKCDLARKLDDMGFKRNQLPDWMCLVQSESEFNSKAKGPMNTDGSYDWGIFQINDRYWCDVGRRGKECNADCISFIEDDDITEDIICARKIFQISGFEAWEGWKKQCRGKSLTKFSVKECF